MMLVDSHDGVRQTGRAEAHGLQGEYTLVAMTHPSHHTSAVPSLELVGRSATSLRPSTLNPAADLRDRTGAYGEALLAARAGKPTAAWALLLREAYGSGDARAAYALAVHASGFGRRRQIPELLRFAASKGVPEAFAALGLNCELGDFGERVDDGVALQWYLQGALLGDRPCVLHVGRHFVYGLGCRRRAFVGRRLLAFSRALGVHEENGQVWTRESEVWRAIPRSARFIAVSAVDSRVRITASERAIDPWLRYWDACRRFRRTQDADETIVNDLKSAFRDGVSAAASYLGVIEALSTTSHRPTVLGWYLRGLFAGDYVASVHLRRACVLRDRDLAVIVAEALGTLSGQGLAPRELGAGGS